MTTPVCPSCPALHTHQPGTSPSPWGRWLPAPAPMAVLYTLTPMVRSPSKYHSTVPNYPSRVAIRGTLTHPNPGLPQALSLGLTGRQEDAPHTALAETKLLKNVVKMG